MTTPLISAPALRALMASGAPLLVFDCRFDLAQPELGAQSYLEGHLPGAIYLHLDRDLSGPRAGGAGAGGRHPLPGREAFAARLATLGCQDDLPVVAYDTSGGMVAARLWWMLRWLGHAAVQVLDGGLAAWDAAGGALAAGAVPPRGPGRLTLRPPLTRSIGYDELRAGLGGGPRLIVDARAADRFRGENETIDPVAGHIPGAVNRFFRDNLLSDGRFKPIDRLRAEWLAVMAARQPADLVQQCGSGVTACHNLLAMEAAGLRGAALYPGSWSDWCARPDAPIATGG
ncbi:MAG: sulfurtransferase [Burkholderiaceae bacterium]|nr:sulfurtransferase [Burkholderiaceae bacterium]